MDNLAWPNAGWWKRKQENAQKMQQAALVYSAGDCREAAKACTDDAGKYLDEMSIYVQELRKRGARVHLVECPFVS